MADADSSTRDQLARDRTHLANERTLLAYVRTAIGLVAGGVAVGHLYEGPGGRWAAGALLVAAAVLLVVGIRRYRTVRSHLNGG